MPQQLTLIYTVALLRQAVFAFWRRTVGVGFFVAVVLLGGSLAFFLWLGDRSWIVGALGAFLAFGLAFAALVYFVHLRNTLAKFHAMGSPSASFELGESSFTLSSGIGSSSIQWACITELWRFKSFWLLLFSKGQFITLPLASVPEDAQSFILGRIGAAGAKVVQPVRGCIPGATAGFASVRHLKHSAPSADVLVKTRSCYAAICDEASPANRLGFMHSGFDAAKNADRIAGECDHLDLFVFNDQLIHSARRGELLAWTLLFDGVFRAVARFESPSTIPESQASENLGSSALAADLVCPTGKLILTCLARLGEKQRAFLAVEPGIYRVLLERNETEELEHTGLEEVSSYPVGQGPDWYFRIQKIGPLAAAI